MNKHLIALALLGLTAGAASAQSSITLFGVVDVAARSLKTGNNSVKELASDGNSSSRFGFRGEEDLGNGLKAGFWLEAPLAPDTGKGDSTRLFNRRSTVSLLSAQAGEVRLGRDNLTVWNNAAAFDPFGTVGVGTVTALISKAGATVDTKRTDNAVSYILPGNLGGIYGQVQVAAGEGIGGKNSGVRLGYKAGAFDAAVATTSVKSQTSSSNTAEDGSKWKQLHAGASYDFSVVKLFAEYITVKRTFNNGTADRKEKIWELAATAPVGAAGVAKLAYAKASDYAQATKIAVGYQHNLSKRTALYGTYGQIKNKNANANFTVAGDTTVPAVAGPNTKSTGYEIGVRHNF